MGKVFVRKTVSLDGFIADKDDGVGRLMRWYRSGDAEFKAFDRMVFRLPAVSLEGFEEMMRTTGAVVDGITTCRNMETTIQWVCHILW
ncbi:MAG: hypothetical protein L0154_06230 [Chloroflexi bacterium]|nr:hypothetical protein [Chloroflexota bacterium]